jgi:hypothetical protein
MIPVEDEFNNILFGHLWQLPCKNILEIDEKLDAFMGLVIFDDRESDLMALLLLPCSVISCHKS